MKTEVIYAQLDEIRKLVEDHADAQGNVNADEDSIHIALKFCKMEIQKALYEAED